AGCGRIHMRRDDLIPAIGVIALLALSMRSQWTGKMRTYSNPDGEIIKEIVREAEAYLDGQVTLATSADQRASVMASVFAAAGTAIAAALMTVAAQQHDNDYTPIFAGGGAAAGMFILGAVFCVMATMPSDFHLPGSQPTNWKHDLAKNTPLSQALAEQA